MTTMIDKNAFPLITIGICAYKSADTVGRAIESALAQTWPNLEVLIVDDGSGDDTPGAIRAAIKDNPRARLIEHPKNRRFPGALNTVIDNARGEFIAIFDDDDLSHPDRVKIQYETIQSYEKRTGARLVACWGSGDRLYPNGYLKPFEAIGSKDLPPVGEMAADFLLFYGKKKGVFYGNGTPSGTLMTRKSTYDAVGKYDESMIRSEDTDFSMRLALKGGHFIGTREKVITQYATGGVEKKPEVNYQSYNTLMEKYRDYLISKNRYHYAKNWNRLRLYHFSRQRGRELGMLALLFLRNPILTWTHFWSTAPKRILHEIKMARKASA